ncbi:DTW domain-containing protein [Sulfurimonas sp. MAG313]|nr:tRNA-uridine aminocarboxypropyltransferase [Sulfurimonas sp. MAG313]MDF1881940.1 DTW domain-containing protein [Sulfurimonas sp. MAG313]
MYQFQRCKTISNRDKCYTCFRPMSSCMCKYIKPIDTKTKFVILMHPHEFKKIKNGTGHFTHLSLTNSELYINTSFINHKKVNDLLKNNNCYVLYPSTVSIVLNDNPLPTNDKDNVIFLIDSTWHNAKKLLRDSPNIQELPKVSFTHTKASEFKIKEQPMELCLSTMESTLCVLELLTLQGNEKLSVTQLKGFLEPFTKMVEYQLECIKVEKKSPRFRI